MLDLIKKYIHLWFIKVRCYFTEYLRWALFRNDSSSCRIFYGHAHLPGKEEKASGGIIKCQDLQRDFPNNLRNANILYLVSSALPFYPKFLIDRARKRGVKLVWNQNGVAYPAWHGPGWEKTNLPLSAFLHQADYVIYQSEFCKVSADHYLGSFEGPSTILHNPVDINLFVPSDGAKPGLKLLVAGTHNEKYRIRLAVEIFSRVVTFRPDAELTIAGPFRWKNEQKNALEDVVEMTRGAGVEGKVTLLGAYSQDDAISIFQSHHILLHTQYNDACPRLVVEAMSCGVPVVYSSSGGTPELVGDQGGIGIKVPFSWEKIYLPDVAEMAKAVKNISEDYLYYSNNARLRAKRQFDVRKWVSAHKAIFEDFLK